MFKNRTGKITWIQYLGFLEKLSLMSLLMKWQEFSMIMSLDSES